MPFDQLLSIAGAVLISIGGGAAVVFALSKYLGGVWASRILENERATLTREHELLVRRRNIYSKLAQTLRVFLKTSDPITREQRQDFLATYDEAALWAAEEVICSVGMFLDMNAKNTSAEGSVSSEALRAAYAHCITAMRKDSGFPKTEYVHRVVSF
jgi:hypothetical protein